jgi:hypothetical protein
VWRRSVSVDPPALRPVGGADELFAEERSPRSVSDYAIVKRVFQIFERAVRKFKGDVGLWMEYIRVVEKVGAKALVGKVTAR